MVEEYKKPKRKVVDIKPPYLRKEKEEIFSKKVLEEEELEINIFKREPLEKPKEKITPSEKKKEEVFFEEPEYIFKEKPSLKLPFKKSVLFTILGVIALGFLFYYLSFVVFARADISITTKKMEVPLSSKIVFDSNVSSVDYEKGIIPANLFVFKESASQDFTSTGRGKDEKKATGVVTLFNNYSTSPQVLVATTRLSTPDGKIFRLDSRIVIPAATTEDGKLVPSSIDVKVTADEAGPEYNIAPCELPNCKFTIVGFKGTPKYEGFYGISKNPMTGGASSAMPMVTADDIRKGEEAILKKISEAINKSIEDKLPKNLKLLPEGKSGLKITNLDSDAEVGDLRQTFSLTAEGEMKVLAYKEEDVISYIQKQLEKDKDEKYVFYKNPEFTLQFIKADFSQGILEVNLEAKQVLRFALNEEEIKKEVLGKSQKEILKGLENTEGISKITIKLKPYWLSKIPKNLSKVKLSID
ncbi:MAG TPA: hypothetical protein PK119_01460 [Candidatus Paceibacterota bacterium]|nr:hypothetical protein [Candidatus Paceibacterota bacterium]